MADSDTLRRLWRYKSDLEEGPDEEKLIQILKRLYKLHVSISSLQETRIGKVVNSFRQKEGIVGEWAKKVVAIWKSVVEKEVSKKKDVVKERHSPTCEQETDNSGDHSDASQDSWASWDDSEEKMVPIKREKDEERSDRSKESKSRGGDVRTNNNSRRRQDDSECHKDKTKHEEKEKRKSSGGGGSVHRSHDSDSNKSRENLEKENRRSSSSHHSHSSDRVTNKDKHGKDQRKISSSHHSSDHSKDGEKHEKDQRKSSSHRSSDHRKDGEKHEKDQRKSSSHRSSDHSKDGEKHEKDQRKSSSHRSSDHSKDREKHEKDEKKSSSSHHSSDHSKDKEKHEKDQRNSSSHHSHDHSKDREKHEKGHRSSGSGHSHKSSHRMDRETYEKENKHVSSKHDVPNSDKRKDKERQRKDCIESSRDIESDGSVSSASHHHDEDMAIKREKQWSENGESRVPVKKDHILPASKGRLGKRGGGDDDSDEEDLTDSDAEPEKSVSDISSIEQYYKTMLGQVDEGKVGRVRQERENPEHSKSHSDSRSSKSRDKYFKSSSKASHKDTSFRSSDHMTGSGSRSGMQKLSSPSVKGKSQESVNEQKHLKVDRKRKNHTMSDSDEDEEGSSDSGVVSVNIDKKSDSAKNRDSHSNPTKPSLYQSSVSHPKSSSSSSHHKSRPSSSSTSLNHKSSSSSSHEKLSSSSSHHKMSSSLSSAEKSHKSTLSSSSHSAHRHSKSKSSSSLSKSSPHSHHSKPSSSLSNSSHHKSSSSTSSPSHRSSKTNGNDDNQYNPLLLHDESPPPYSPNRVTIKTEKEDRVQSSSALYTPTPIASRHNLNTSDSSDTDNSNEDVHDSDHESVDSSNINQYSSIVKREVDSDSGSESDNIYEPKKKVKYENESEENFNSECDDAYIPTEKIKKEKSDDSDAYLNGKHKYGQPGKKIKQGVDTKGDYHYSHESRAEDDDSLSTGYRQHINSGLPKNKYLESLGRVLSSDGDEERYSPTHGWKVKGEKTTDDFMYGGGEKGHESSGSEANYEEQGAATDKNCVVSHKQDKKSESKSKRQNEREKLASSADRKTSSEKSSIKNKEHASADNSRSSMRKSEGSKGREKDKGRDTPTPTSSHDKKHSSSSSSSQHHNGHKDGKGHSHRDSSGSSSKEKHKHSSLADKRTVGKSTPLSNDTKSSTKPSVSSSSTSSSKTPKTSTPHPLKKKSKPKAVPEPDAEFDLFSDAIQIKKENMVIPTRSDVKKKQSSSSSSSALVKSSSSSCHSGEKRSATNSQSSRSMTSDSKGNRHDISYEKREDSGYVDMASASPEPDMSEDSPERVDPGGDASKMKKKKKEAAFLDDSTMSFDDFLNFDESAALKKTGAKMGGGSKTSSPIKKFKTSSSSSSSLSRSKKADIHRSSPSPTVPKPSSDLTVTESDIMSLLPATQAYYRPIRRNPAYQDDVADVEDSSQVPEFDPDVIGTKSDYIRSKVYSGKKHVIKELKSLHELCLFVLIDNIDALDHVGPIPYFILKPVLERCTPQQLYRLEDCNPHFIEDSDELWQIHSKREFMGAQREELETWRELFLRCYEAREAKYQKLKANMSMTISKGQAGRPARLAYVDTVAKPPREVLRQQKRHGTGCVVKLKHRPGYNNNHRHPMRTGSGRSDHAGAKAYKPSLAVPTYNPMDDRPKTMRATPAMMARALQMRKNMRR